MKKIAASAVLSLIVLSVSGHVFADDVVGDSSKGEAVFSHMCATCHSLTANRIGPMLGGVYGRKAGTAAGFNYSPAIQASGISWDAKSLDQWLSGPQKFISGSKMTFNVSDAQKRADVIAYLKDQK